MASRLKELLPVLILTGVILMVIGLVVFGLSSHREPSVAALARDGRMEFEGVTVERRDSGAIQVETHLTTEGTVYGLAGTAVLIFMLVITIGLLGSRSFAAKHKLLVIPPMLAAALLGLWFVWGRWWVQDEVTFEPAGGRLEHCRTRLFGLSTDRARLPLEQVEALMVFWVPSRGAKVTGLRVRFADGSERTLFQAIADRGDLGAYEALRDYLAASAGVRSEDTQWRWLSW